MQVSTDTLKNLFAAALKADLSSPPSGQLHAFGECLDREETSEERDFDEFVKNLSLEEARDILALMWLGLGKGFESFSQARRQVAGEHDVFYAIRSRPHLIVSSVIDGLRMQLPR